MLNLLKSKLDNICLERETAKKEYEKKMELLDMKADFIKELMEEAEGQAAEQEKVEEAIAIETETVLDETVDPETNL